MRQIVKTLAVFGFSTLALVLYPSLFLKQRILGTAFVLGDLVDLVLTAPIFFVFFLLIDRAILRAGQSRSSPAIQVLKALALVLYYEGHGIHFAANSVNNLIRDVPISEPVVQSLVNYYDEFLGHQLTNIGLLSLIAAGNMSQLQNPLPHRASTAETYTLLASGTVSGVVLGLSFLEGQFAVPGLVMGLLLLIAILSLLRMRGESLKSHPVSLFSVVGLIVSFVLVALWGIVHGRFVQPSELGF